VAGCEVRQNGAAVPRISSVILAVIVCLLCTAPAGAAPPDPLRLSAGWQRAMDPADQGFAQDLPSGRAGTGWRPVAVPDVFDPRPDPASFRGTIGWYRTTFTPPRAATGAGWALRFEQVRRTARVWLNGREIGSHRDPYTPFELPAAGLQGGRPNTLVVRVDNRKGAEPREGWWNWGGITRAVSLVPHGAVVGEDLGVLPRRTCADGRCRWSVLADGWLENRSGSPQRPSVAVRLRSPDGVVSRGASAPRVLRPGERVRVRFAVPVRGEAQLWSPERPALYRATVATRVGGRTVQVERHRVGLRTVRVEHGMFRLNGRVLDLRGASVQEDMKGHGPVLTADDIDRIVGDLKALGANVTRAHYLLDERLLDRFDEEGILVWSQAPVYHRDVGLRSAAGRAYEMGVLRDTILAARNHPSVLTHSVANELSPEPDTERTTGLWLRNAAALARDLDPTLPVSVDLLSYPRIAEQRTYDRFDALGLNSYYGWYAGKADRSTANLGDLAAYLRNMHAKYPRHALVMTEFGAEATEDGPATRKQTYAFQQRYLQRNLDVVDRLGFMGGAIYWTAREFAVKPRWDGGAHPEQRDAIHNKALIAYDGTRKPAWSTAQDAFRATPLYRDDPRAVARAQLANPAPILGSSLLVAGVLTALLALLGFYAWLVRDIWRASRPQPPASAEVMAIRRAA
jgi:hypothetical protein